MITRQLLDHPSTHSRRRDLRGAKSSLAVGIGALRAAVSFPRGAAARSGPRAPPHLHDRQGRRPCWTESSLATDAYLLAGAAETGSSAPPPAASRGQSRFRPRGVPHLEALAHLPVPRAQGEHRSCVESMATWPPSWGPKPDYPPLQACRLLDDATYGFMPPNYGFKMLLCGCFPILGGFFQAFITPPDTAEGNNTDTALQIQATLVAWEATSQKETLAYWQDMNNILRKITTQTNNIRNIMTLPLRHKLMYLAASVVALCMLTVAILMGL